MWIGIGEGLVRYLDGTFENISKKNKLPEIFVSSLAEDLYGHIWIGTGQNYLYRYDSKKISHYDTSNGLADLNIYSLCADSKGNLWVGTFSEGLFKGYNGNFQEYELEGVTERYPFTIYSIIEGRKGHIWVGSSEGLFQLKEGVLHTYTPAQGLSSPVIFDIKEDSDGNIWVGTRSGVCRIKENPSGEISIDPFLGYTEAEGHIVINRLFEDRERSLWIGTVGFDMKRLREARFSMYSRKDGIPNFNLTLFNDHRGDSWVGTMNGEIYRFKDGAFTRIAELENPSEAAEITALEEDAEGNIWLGTAMRGIFQLKNGRLIPPVSDRAPNPRYRVYAIYKDSKNNLWFATYLGGLSCYSNGTFKTYTTADGLPSNWITNLLEDKQGNLRVGTNRGIAILPNGRWDKGGLKTYLPGTQISALYEDEEGVSWIGAYGSGLVRLQGERHFSYTTADGLGSEYIFQVVEDTRGDLWMSSYDGVMKINKKELNDFAAGKIKRLDCVTFGLSDGMKSVLCSSRNRNSIVKTPTGELWFATRKGIAAINPDKIRINKTPPPVVFKKIVFNYRTITPDQEGKSVKGIKDILFYFTSPTFISRERVKFKYRLEGYDTDWKLLEAGQERMAHYQNLPDGRFTFKVIACNSDGIRNEAGASFTFTLTPFFYETLLFKILGGGFLVLLFIGTYYGLKKYLRFQRTKNKYKHSTLDSSKTEKYVQQLLFLLQEEKIYKTQDLSLDSLAQKLSITARELSQLINEQFNKNFWGLINQYRMEEAIALLKNPGKKPPSIPDIAFAVGFNTKEAFHRVFKKHTGMSPIQYKKTLKNKG